MASSLFLSLVVGSVGLGVFTYGKKTQRMPHLVAGLLLMVYPYFTDTAATMLAVGVVIVAGLFGAVWLGW